MNYNNTLFHLFIYLFILCVCVNIYTNIITDSSFNFTTKHPPTFTKPKHEVVSRSIARYLVRPAGDEWRRWSVREGDGRYVNRVEGTWIGLSVASHRAAVTYSPLTSCSFSVQGHVFRDLGDERESELVSVCVLVQDPTTLRSSVQ